MDQSELEAIEERAQQGRRLLSNIQILEKALQDLDNESENFILFSGYGGSEFVRIHAKPEGVINKGYPISSDHITTKDLYIFIRGMLEMKLGQVQEELANL